MPAGPTPALASPKPREKEVEVAVEAAIVEEALVEV
jgi:hypothetical protein